MQVSPTCHLLSWLLLIVTQLPETNVNARISSSQKHSATSSSSILSHRSISTGCWPQDSLSTLVDIMKLDHLVALLLQVASAVAPLLSHSAWQPPAILQNQCSWCACDHALDHTACHQFLWVSLPHCSPQWRWLSQCGEAADLCWWLSPV